MNLIKKGDHRFVPSTLLLLAVFAFMILGAATTRSDLEPEYSLRAFFEGYGWLILFQGEYLILVEAFCFMLIPTVWLSIPTILTWKNPKSVLRTTLLGIIAVLWLLWALLCAYPEIHISLDQNS